MSKQIKATTESIKATREDIQNLRNVNTISCIQGKTCTFYTVTFFNGKQETYFVRD